MYLLNPEGFRDNVGNKIFTFHYVSIKSQNKQATDEVERNLHSTMYLLNLGMTTHITPLTTFTFHYVSIKSYQSLFTPPSTLLFTFHYVSIKSDVLGSGQVVSPVFTFHYVSIKSR